MKALVYKGPFNMQIEEIDPPELGLSEVMVRVCAVGICGSDIHGFAGKTGRRFSGMVMGHEISGEITSVGKSVKDFAPGQKVAVQPIIYCKECEMCISGKTSICLNKKMIGVNMGKIGGLSEYIAVPKENVFSIPHDIPHASACLAEPFAVGVNVARIANLQKKQTVIIVGAGVIGLSIILMIKKEFSGEIFIVDKNDKKLKMAETWGAIPINFSKENPVERVLKETNGRGVDISIEAVGISESVKTALYATKTGGHLIWIGNSQKFIEFDMQDLVTKGKSIQGIYCYSDEDFRNAVQFIDKNCAIASIFIEEEVTLENAVTLFTELAKNEKELLRAVVLLKKGLK